MKITALEESTMAQHQGGRSTRRHRGEIWAAFLLGLLFLGLGAPLIVQSAGGSETVRAERQVEPRPNG